MGDHASVLATIKACLCGQLAPHSLKISDCQQEFKLSLFYTSILHAILSYFNLILVSVYNAESVSLF